MSKIELPTQIQRIFLNSKINGGVYDGDRLPSYPHRFPVKTWLQCRREELKKKEGKPSWDQQK